MTIEQLHTKLLELKISPDKYYLHGLFGSIDDNEKIALTIRKGKYSIEYETYFKEYGEKHSIRTFTNETEACNWILKKLTDQQFIEKIQNIEGIGGMTVNERLFASGLMNEFDKVIKTNKVRAKEILRWLKVDEKSIIEIVK